MANLPKKILSPRRLRGKPNSLLARRKKKDKNNTMLVHSIEENKRHKDSQASLLAQVVTFVMVLIVPSSAKSGGI